MQPLVSVTKVLTDKLLYVAFDPGHFIPLHQIFWNKLMLLKRRILFLWESNNICSLVLPLMPSLRWKYSIYFMGCVCFSIFLLPYLRWTIKYYTNRRNFSSSRTCFKMLGEGSQIKDYIDFY